MTHHPTDVPQFYLTAPAPCPYLQGKMERKVFTHLVGQSAAAMNDILTQGGFRRSQNIAYRPACETCKACLSVRVSASEFRPSKSQRRILNANTDLIGEVKPTSPTSEQYSLFRDYLDNRHPEGGMADMSALDYSLMVEDTHVNTRLVEYRRRGPDSGITGRGEGELIAVCLIDQLSDGLSMVYSFFKPELSKRSLGSFMILDHISRVRRLGLPYLYLGYWVKGSQKMDYKTRFEPLEVLTGNGWQLYSECEFLK